MFFGVFVSFFVGFFCTAIPLFSYDLRTDTEQINMASFSSV